MLIIVYIYQVFIWRTYEKDFKKQLEDIKV